MKFRNSYFRRHSSFLVGIAALEISCGAAPVSAPVVAPTETPAVQSAEPAPQQSTPPEEPTPVQPAPQVTTVEETVKSVARRDLWPLEPNKAEELLKRFGPIRREQPIDQALSLSGGPTGDVARIQVSYSGDEKGGWTFNVANFYLGAPDLHQLYEAVAKLLNEQLGNPDWSEKRAELPSTEWDLGGSMKLLFAPSPNQGEKLLVLSISEPEGDPE